MLRFLRKCFTFRQSQIDPEREAYLSAIADLDDVLADAPYLRAIVTQNPQALEDWIRQYLRVATRPKKIRGLVNPALICNAIDLLNHCGDDEARANGWGSYIPGKVDAHLKRVQDVLRAALGHV